LAARAEDDAGADDRVAAGVVAVGDESCTRWPALSLTRAAIALPITPIEPASG
jgi:hypothetical protein